MNSVIFFGNSLIFLRNSLIFLRNSLTRNAKVRTANAPVPNGSQMNPRTDPLAIRAKRTLLQFTRACACFFRCPRNRSSRKGGRGEGKPSPLLLEGSKHTTKGRRILGSCWGHFGVTLGSRWALLRLVLGGLTPLTVAAIPESWLGGVNPPSSNCHFGPWGG